MTKSQILAVYFAATLDTEAHLRKSTTLEDLEQYEGMHPSYRYVQSIIVAIQVSMEWGKRLLLATMEFLRRTC